MFPFLQTVIDSNQKLKDVKQSTSTFYDVVINNIAQNPGLFYSFLSGLLLPIIILIINNTNSRKLKKIELNNSKEIKKLEKELVLKSSKNELIENQNRIIFASLSQILFDVQALHVSLSGSCVDKQCIDEALTRFDESLKKYHDEISTCMLYVPSNVINLIYDFYGKISELKIFLRDIDKDSDFAIAHVSVSMGSVELSMVIFQIQNIFVENDSTLKSNFNEAHQQMMKYCCGRRPPTHLFERYIELYKVVKPDFKQEEIERLRLLYSDYPERLR